MRLAIFLGLFFIAEAIETVPIPEANIKVIAGLMVVFAAMDIFEFVKRMNQDEY